MLVGSEGIHRLPTSSVKDGYPHDLTGTSPAQNGEWLHMSLTGYTIDVHRTTVIHIRLIRADRQYRVFTWEAYLV